MTIFWKTARLGEVCQLIKRGISPKYTESDGISVINQKCIRDHRINFNLARKHDISKKKVNPERLVKFADVLVNSTGTGTLGRVAQFLSTDKEPITVDTHVTIVRPIEGVFHPAFFGYVMIFIEEQIIAGGEGASGQTELPRAKLENDFLITYPDSIDEQKRIVAILDEAFAGIDTAIANTEKNLANARELFESYLNSTFLCTRPSWQKTALSETCSIKHGFAFKSKYFTSEGQYIVLTPGSFYESGGFRDQGKKTKFYDAEVPEGYLLKKDDLLFAMTEQAVGLLGSSLIVPESDRFLHNQRLGLVKPFDNIDWHNDFFFHQFNTAIFRSAVQSSASGVKVRHTSPSKLGAIKVLIPPYIEQVEIAKNLSYLSSEACKLANIAEQKISSLNELKRSILNKAFSGDLTANNVVEITAQKQPKAQIDPNSPEFAAHIMAAAYHWHASQSREKTFGRVKAQKTLHLMESLADIDLGRQPIKDAAGPNDFQHMQRAEDWARNRGFFEFVKRPTGQRGYDFRKGAHYGDLVAEAMQALAPYENVLKRVIKVLMPLNTAETEILATVYAAWNNLLLEGIKPTENAIIHEARENWHADKLKYSEEQFRNAISQLRHNGLVPQGRGKRVTGQESLAL